MSAIYRRKDFSRFDLVILANNSQPWDQFKIGHGEGVYGWNYNVSSFYLPKRGIQIAVVNGYRSFPKFDFSFDFEKEKEFSKKYRENWLETSAEKRNEMIIDFIESELADHGF